MLSVPLPDESPARAQPPGAQQLPDELRYVPPDAAVFAWFDVATVWDGPLFKSLRKTEAKAFDELLAAAKKDFGGTPDDLKSVALFIPAIRGPQDTDRLGVVITFRNAHDKEAVAKRVAALLGKSAKVKVVAATPRTAVVLANLGDEYAKPQPAGKTGPLTDAIRESAAGTHAAVVGVNLAALPDEIRGDDIPPQLRPFQPLFKAQTVTATVDIGKELTLDVRVKTATAGQAVDCEKSLGLLLSVIQDELGKGLKELEADAALKDLVAVMKAAGAAAKGAKFATLGTEARMTVSLPTELPFAGAFASGRRKVKEAADLSSSSINLKQIAIAFHNYESAHQTFPPAAVCDKTGKPLLSWRVLILPDLEEDKLFKEFKLDEPWDSENNKKLLAKMPKVYALPGKTQPGDTTTHYRVFVEKGAALDWVMGPKIVNFTDGTSNTILAVTAADAVPWTKPDELVFDPEKDMTKLVGLVVGGRLQVAFADGHVRTFDKIPAKATLHALITRNGGEVIPDLP